MTKAQLKSSEAWQAKKRLDTADTLQDIFGDSPETAAEQYFLLSTATKESLYRDERLIQKIDALYAKVVQAVDEGRYGEPIPIYLSAKITAGGKTYVLSRPLVQTDTAKIFRGTFGDRDAIIKMSSYGDDFRGHNIGLEVEQRILTLLWRKNPEEPNLRHLPELLSHFVYQGAQCNVLSYAPGYTFPQLLSSPCYMNGVPDKHLVWIMARALTTLGTVHDLGILNTNLTPHSFIVSPEDHNVTLVGWSQSRFAKFGLELAGPCDPIYTPNDEAPTPSMDLYSLGKCIIYLSGGDPATGTPGPGVSKELGNMLRWMTRDSYLQRPRDAFELTKDLREIRQALHGARRFFPMYV